MKRLLPLIICLAVVLAAFLCVHANAAADGDVTQQYITADYYTLGTVYSVSAYADEVAVLRAKDGVAYLTVMGGTFAEVALQVEVEALADMHMAYYDGKALLSIDDYLWVYDMRNGNRSRTSIRTVYDSEGLMGTVHTPLTHFAVDENGRVYVGYQIYIGWLPFADIYNEGQLFNEDTVTVLSQSTHNYTSFTAHNGVCLFYRTSGTIFAINTNDKSATDISDAGAMTQADMLLQSTATQPIFLRNGTVQGDNVTYIAKADVVHAGDAYLLDATAFCTSQVGEEWRIWVVDNGQAAVKVYNGQFTYLGMYGAWGTADGRLHDPCEVAHDKMVVVNDRGNHRTVVLRAGEYSHLDGNATCLTTVGERVFVGRNDKVICYDYAHPTNTLPYSEIIYEVPSDVLAVCADDTTVYALTADNIYLLRNTEHDVTPTMPVQAVRIKSGRHQGTVYVQTSNAIIPYKDLEPIGVSVDVTGMLVVDFDVDYCGNVYVLEASGTLHCFLRNADGYTDSLLTLHAPLSALSIDADGGVYGLSDSALVALNLPVRTRENSAYAAPQWDDPVSVVHVLQSVWGYASPNNYESVVRVPGNTYAMLMATHRYEGEDYYYIEFALSALNTVRYEKVYIPKQDVTLVGYGAPTDAYVRYDGASDSTGLYAHPSYSAEAVRVVPKAEARFEVVCVMGVENGVVVWPWYMVRVGDATYYVAKDNYVSAEPPYVEVERYYARCVANKLGEKVPVYAAPDTQAEIVTTLVDGTKVELVAPFDANSEFTCIRIDDKEVYILTANVTTRNMTNGQTFALIMSIIVICLAAVTLVLYLLVQKRR